MGACIWAHHSIWIKARSVVAALWLMSLLVAQCVSLRKQKQWTPNQLTVTLPQVPTKGHSLEKNVSCSKSRGHLLQLNICLSIWLGERCVCFPLLSLGCHIDWLVVSYVLLGSSAHLPAFLSSCPFHSQLPQNPFHPPSPCLPHSSDITKAHPLVLHFVPNNSRNGMLLFHKINLVRCCFLMSERHRCQYSPVMLASLCSLWEHTMWSFLPLFF